ncbi:NADH:ubiquinone reductase (Na(+)-transporting) subunit F [Bacteroidales bacterium OttesenSCG-928-B11]|nr:NADH:ubiquinone reductase (Na(+)-transporting) subunit F [Bacteroidales bacterium OttesenSCG-928-B11]MDL2326604.1 NADH:ubiquinone reductase (Na(+)-transporting) subunit F [Bacteroidales bacterium OttesenSCG-928-A14]
MKLLTIFLAILIFLIIIWLLVAVLLITRKKLVPEGEVGIRINEERELKTERGKTLLQALSDDGVLMSSACGGGGTCGLCKGKVTQGGGAVLPTEKIHLTHKQQEDNYRLFCQVKVKEDMEIEIDKAIFGVKKWKCTVVSNRSVATYIRELIVTLPEGESMDFIPGGYIQIDVPKGVVNYPDFQIEENYRNEWEANGLLDLTMKNNEITTRAYSMANYPAEGNKVILNVRIALPPFDTKKQKMKKVNPGIASSYIYGLRPGDEVTVAGPYGDFFVRDTKAEMMFIGGGAGMAPMRSQIFDLFKTKKTSRKTTFWYGGRSKKELFYMDEFREIEKENPNFAFHIALSEPKPEDQWGGYTGFIHQVIADQYLQNHSQPENIEYYICGPPLMLQSVLKMLDDFGVPEENIFYDDFGG